ncbi:MAG: Superoxide dismutase (Mn) [Tenericutes bacterium ADurb.Bin239]|jgi:Fe-Mn family superoxide dismutase|nr:MAG: Superoxide dismutase (Mn) [Tenericutes bacterium ADurb.Bin239]
MHFVLKPLPYAFDALEPYIDAKTMEIHHGKHHAGYVNNLNAALAKEPAYASWNLEKLLTNLDKLPESIRTAVRNNGGGHFNHELFWTLLKVNKGKGPDGKLKADLVATFGSVEAFKDEFATAAKTRFGSGWAFLIVTNDKKLKVLSTPNQDTPLHEGRPILALDVWEHAYYLKYQNRRPEYVDAFFNVVNWDEVARLYEKALK